MNRNLNKQGIKFQGLGTTLLAISLGLRDPLWQEIGYRPNFLCSSEWFNFCFKNFGYLKGVICKIEGFYFRLFKFRILTIFISYPILTYLIKMFNWYSTSLLIQPQWLLLSTNFWSIWTQFLDLDLTLCLKLIVTSKGSYQNNLSTFLAIIEIVMPISWTVILRLNN